LRAQVMKPCWSNPCSSKK